MSRGEEGWHKDRNGEGCKNTKIGRTWKKGEDQIENRETNSVDNNQVNIIKRKWIENSKSLEINENNPFWVLLELLARNIMFDCFVRASTSLFAVWNNIVRKGMEEEKGDQNREDSDYKGKEMEGLEGIGIEWKGIKWKGYRMERV